MGMLYQFSPTPTPPPHVRPPDSIFLRYFISFVITSVTPPPPHPHTPTHHIPPPNLSLHCHIPHVLSPPPPPTHPHTIFLLPTSHCIVTSLMCCHLPPPPPPPPQVLLVLWEQSYSESHYTYHVHESLPGLLLLLLRLALAGLFSLNLRTTIAAERSVLRKDFYQSFAVVSGRTSPPPPPSGWGP